MKNYFQIANQFTNSKIFGFDNNPINPNFANTFDTVNTRFLNQHINQMIFITFVVIFFNKMTLKN